MDNGQRIDYAADDSPIGAGLPNGRKGMNLDEILIDEFCSLVV